MYRTVKGPYYDASINERCFSVASVSLLWLEPDGMRALMHGVGFGGCHKRIQLRVLGMVATVDQRATSSSSLDTLQLWRSTGYGFVTDSLQPGRTNQARITVSFAKTSNKQHSQSSSSTVTFFFLPSCVIRGGRYLGGRSKSS